MQVNRRRAWVAALSIVLAVAIAFSAAPVQSLSSGVATPEVGTGTARGCTCHSPTASNTARINFDLEGLPSGYYEGGKTYTVRLSFADDTVPPNSDPTANHGGFNVLASGGAFKLNANSTIGGAAFVAVKDSGTSITHTKEGDVGGNRSFTFDWTAPQSNQSNVQFDILVNAVNGDNVQSSADHWSRKVVVLAGVGGASSGAVDISKLGVPLRAYWLGVIGILSTIFLLILSFYVIRSGSKFYEFGLPRGQVKNVKIRTIPAPKNKGAFAVITLLLVIDLVILFVFFSTPDAQVDALQASLFLMAFFIVIALIFTTYIRAFLPIVDVLEEESIEPLR
jgi:hypothetical protein